MLGFRIRNPRARGKEEERIGYTVNSKQSPN